MLITNSLLLIAGAANVAYAATVTSSGLAPQFSPSFPNMKAATGVVTSYNPGPYDTSKTLSTDRLKGYPNTWEIPSTTSAEVKAAYNKIDWSKVPKAPVRKQKSDGSWVSTSDGPSDPYCWWSSTNCLKPKVSYLPEDVYTCPKNVWGLNYDDGPFNRYTDENAAKENPYAEPALYNFLAERNLHASLFYVGSNVVNYPAAAKRGLNDGNHLCVHTWSHQPMTTLTNAQIVAELYWSLKAIKESTGVTTKCWRPPQGDVDDRVRSIAWQMGMRTILWNEDTNDWAMPAPGGGDLSPKKVDAAFAGWIKNEKAGKNKEGLLVLEHELNSATVNMSMHWIPEITKTFTVLPALACAGISKPYWEENFVYPIAGSPTTPTKTVTTTATATPTTAPGSCTAGSSGLGKGDGYNGACCKDQSDCLDDCLSGKCNGPVNPATKTNTATATATPTTAPGSCTAGSSGLGKGDGYNGACCKDQSDCLDDCLSGKCNGPVNPATKTTTKKTSTKTTTKAPTSTASCLPGARGKKRGNGKTGYCCSSSDDCLETCRNKVCGL